MSLHPLCVSLGIVRGRRRVREAGGGSVLSQPCFRTLLALSWPWPWSWSWSWSWSRPRPGPLSCWIHLISRPFLYGRSKAHAVAGILGGVSVVVVRQLGGALQQAAVSGVISGRLKGRVGRRLLALRHPGEGVELGVGGVGHPGWGAGVVAACPGTWDSAGGNGTAGAGRGSAGSGSHGSGVLVGRAELALVVDGSGLGARLVVGGGSDVVVAVGRIL